MVRRHALLAVGCLALMLGGSCYRPFSTAIRALPDRMVWAWSRPEDLRWLPRDVGVAYVASAVELVGDEAIVRPRAAPLQLRPGVVLVPMVHVDASWRHPPVLNAAQRRAVVDQLALVAQSANARVVQLDFEVRKSQQPFLARVVSDARARLPREMGLSMTALASWCAGDDWLRRIAADEIVPMAFRMAADDAALRRQLAEQGGFNRARCMSAAGMATDEPIQLAAPVRRYYFSPTAWTPQRWSLIQERQAS